MRFRRFLENYWGTKGAGILPIATDTRKLLVSLRSEHVNEPGTYGVIGGKIDNDSNDPSVEAKREFLEETGYSGALRLVPSYVFKDNDFQYYNFIGIVPKEFTPRLNWESKSMTWITLDELLKLEPKHFGLRKLLKHSIKQIQTYCG